MYGGRSTARRWVGLTTILALRALPDAPPVDPITPADDDADVTVTARKDADNNTIRPARVTMLHAVDSARNADLVEAHRMDLDRYESTSDRTHRLPATGHHARILCTHSRAGEAFALRELVIEYDLVPADNDVPSDTTTRTDMDGTTMVVGTTRIFHAANSGRNADLASQGTEQDRFWTKHAIPMNQVADVHRLLLEHDGRAGVAWAPEEVVVEYVLVQEGARAGDY